MKINFKLPAIVLGLLLLLSGTTVKAQDDNVSLQQFYDELSPYGTWIKDPQYGYVWRPDVDQADFRPYYSNGRWAMTEYGNTWVSNYDWGWAPFHYGRWIYDSYSRWVWIPDTTWGPAWVDWRSGDGYYGWAPMAPLISININIGRRYVRPDYCWNFIPQGHIYYTSWPRYRSYNNVRIINRTTIINNTYVINRKTYYTGPRPEEVRRATNQDVRVYQLARNNRMDAPRIDRNTVNIYSPRPTRDNQTVNAAPRNVGTYGNNGRGDNRISNNRDNNPRVTNRTENNGQDRRTGGEPSGRVTDRTTERRTDGGTITENGGRDGRNNNPVTRTEQPAQQNRQQEQRQQQVQQQQRDQQDRQMRDQQATQQREQQDKQVRDQQQRQQRDQQDRQMRDQQATQQREQQDKQARDQQQRQQQAQQQQRDQQQQQRQQQDRQMQQAPRQQSTPQRTEQSRGTSGGGRGESGGGGRPARGGR